MQPAFESLAAGFPYLIFYLVMVTAIYILGLVAYIWLTPHKEIELVQNGNTAAAIHLSALIISLALPICACLINKFSLFDVGVWAIFSLLLQLFLFRVTDYIIFRGMPNRIERDEVGPTIVLAAFKLAGSLILAFAIAG